MRGSVHTLGFYLCGTMAKCRYVEVASRSSGFSRSTMEATNLRLTPSCARYSCAVAIAFTTTRTGIGPLVVTATSSPSRMRPAMAPASLKTSVFSLAVRSSSSGSRSTGLNDLVSSNETFEPARTSCSNTGAQMRSTGVASSSKYFRAIAMAFIAWLIAVGPVASTESEEPRASRITLQMAPATVLGLDSLFTLSVGWLELATSTTEALAMWSVSLEPWRGGRPPRWYGAARSRAPAVARVERVAPTPGARRPPPGARLVSLEMMSSRLMSTGAASVGRSRAGGGGVAGAAMRVSRGHEGRQAREMRREGGGEATGPSTSSG
mmetsp:Transcript_17771/g.37774  ORF Transcript_17771/g.37774 Transcript_17771/m.37774 type:complete len:322 (-) Transcript_17771:280-1245(-)